MFEYPAKDIEALMKGIFEGAITSYDLPDKLYFAIAEHLKKGLYSGFGSSLAQLEIGTTDFALLEELRENIYMFSGAKTFQQVKEISGLLTGPDKRTEYKEFKKEAGKIFTEYNETWLKTEYNTAIGQAQSAQKWNQIESEKDVLPILQYESVGSENTCDICRPLNGLTAPVGHPVWRKIYPLNHFGCLCIVIQLAEGKTTKNIDGIVKEVDGHMNDLFKMNPGQDKVVFSDAHPYFDVAKKDKGFAKENFGLPIPDKDKK